jgi:hypothetical protein
MDCGPGIRVDWQSEPHTEFNPASSYLLGAGFSRYDVEKEILRCAQDDKRYAQEDKRYAQDDKRSAQVEKSRVVRSKFELPLQAVPGLQVSQVKK